MFEKVRVSLFPRHSYGRSLKYFQKRILRLNATPHAIAAGLAAGVFVSFTPFLGLHFFLAFLVAYILAGNMLAAAVGTIIGNPLTFPIIWGTTLELGRGILSGTIETIDVVHAAPKEFSYWDLAYIWEPLIKPMVVGGTIIGILFAVPIYVLTRWSIIKYRARRASKIHKRAVLRGQISRA